VSFGEDLHLRTLFVAENGEDLMRRVFDPDSVYDMEVCIDGERIVVGELQVDSTGVIRFVTSDENILEQVNEDGKTVLVKRKWK
jgi:hypothetical protein